MFFIYLVEGILLGFLMAVPIGAIGILCIRRTLNHGKRQGYITGLAGATADVLFSTIYAFGIKLISDFITDHQHEIRLSGGLLLVLMGALLIRSPRTVAVKRDDVLEKTKIYFSTLVLALTNPLVLFGYGAAISVIGDVQFFQSYYSLSMLVIGVFLGSMLWFFTISNLAHRFRVMVTEEKLTIVNRIAGVLLLLIGLSSMWGGVHGML